MKPDTPKVTCSSCQWKGTITECRWNNIEYVDHTEFSASIQLTADIHCPKCNKKLEKK